MELIPQTQIYIVAGVLGVVSGILIIAVGVMCVLLKTLQRRVQHLEEHKASATLKTTSTKVSRNIEVDNEQDYAFNEPSIKSGEVLSRRGYVMSTCPDQVGPPRLKSIGNGMYSGMARDLSNFDSMGGTKDATNDFILNPSRQILNSNSSDQPQRSPDVAHSAPSPNGDYNQHQTSVQSNRQKSQFNDNIMLGNSIHSSSHMASTEFPSIDYDDVVHKTSTTNNSYFNSEQNRLHY